MVKPKKEEDFSYNAKHALAFGTASLTDIITYQTFVFWIFTFYFTVIRLDVVLITLAFIIWSIWNSLNDPLIGYLSDRTHTKWGRRKPWIIFSLIPLALLMLLLFLPPITLGIGDPSLNFMYFIIIIMIFELFYTMFSLNQVSLFPEVFLNLEERAKANNIKQAFGILGLFLATLLPSLLIPDLTHRKYLVNWALVGLLAGIIAFIGGLIFLKWGAKERDEFKNDYKKAPSFFESITLCVKSKSFRWYIPTEVANWYVFGLLPTLIPLYVIIVLNITEPIMVSLLLAVAFLSAFVSLTLWQKLAQKYGPRKVWMISLTVWAISLMPILWISKYEEALIVFIFAGVGLGGSLILIDLIVSDIIDEDEIKTGIRREASYYGVNALFMRLSTILVFISISMVFTNVGWTVYAPEEITPYVIFGIRVLMFIFPAIAIGIGILSLSNYPLDGDRLKQVKEEQKKLHEEKKAKL